MALPPTITATPISLRLSNCWQTNKAASILAGVLIAASIIGIELFWNKNEFQHKAIQSAMIEGNSELALNRAKAYLSKYPDDEKEQALAYYQQVIDLEPGFAPAYTSMAMIELEKNHDEEALRLAKKAYEMDFSNARVVANLAIAHHYSGNYNQRDQLTVEAKIWVSNESRHCSRSIQEKNLLKNDDCGCICNLVQICLSD